MLAIRVACLWLLMFTFPNAQGQTLLDLGTLGLVSGESPQTEVEAEPAWIKWMQPLLVGLVILIVAVKVIFWPGERNTRPMTPEEIKEAQERMLNDVSKIRVWEGASRGDGDAIREEMKLIELRNIRRMNE